MDAQGTGYPRWVLHSIQFGWHSPTSGVRPGKLLLAQLSLLRSYACGNMCIYIVSICKEQNKHVGIHILFHMCQFYTLFLQYHHFGAVFNCCMTRSLFVFIGNN